MSMPSKTYLEVEIPLAGDGFPSRQELAARNKITDELDRRKIGGFVGAGGGMGAMDFSYLVEDEAAARRVIEEVIKRVLPQAQYTIEASSGEGIEVEEEGDDEHGDISWPRAIGCLLAMAAGIGLLVWLIWSLLT
jgi:hypothetical protein